jgi:ferredoxin-NADP reductase
MIEERTTSQKPGDAVLIYGNRTIGDIALAAELTALGKKIAMPIYNVLSEQKGYKGETGFVDGEKIKRLVPDVKSRDVYICGPPPMMKSLIAELTAMGVPPAQIHYERFSLHKD